MAYRPEEWSDFFITVGGGAAALTGMAVVAMSMHIRAITTDPVLTHRARMLLAVLGGIFMRCSLVLMGGQSARAVAVELFIVCFLSFGLGLFSYAPVKKIATEHRLSFQRTVWSMVAFGIEMFGAVLLFFGVSWGLNVAATAMVASLAVPISSSWLVLVRIREDEAQ